jgi:hypothetical protein
MNLNPADTVNRAGSRRERAVTPLLLTAALLAVTITAYVGFASASTASTTSSFDNVQVAVHTTSGVSNYSYTVSAYNTTGGLVASYQSQYAAAAFELPSGTYIFTATATQQETLYPGPLVSNGGTESQAVTSSGSGSAVIVCCVYAPSAGSADLCCINKSPATEYGYASQTVSGPTTLTISTKPLNETSASTLTVRVSFPNGSAASGVYLSASVLGDVYGWAYGSGDVSLSSTTGAQGVATLVAPEAPLLVSAETSVPIVLPLNQTTVQVTVAGVKVNVTAFWEPNYLSFAGKALILPPQDSASIVLKYEPQPQGPIPLGVGTQSATAVATGTMTGAPAKSSTPEQAIAQQSSDPASSAAGAATAQPSSSDATIGILALLAVAISVASLGVALFVTRGRPRTASQ